MNKIAVLLTVHNRKSKTLSCLDSLFKAKLPAGYVFDVYLTDDGCTDGTTEAISDLYPQINIIKGDGTLYWNRGMYTAWKEAAKFDYDFYLWLNDDTILFDYSLEILMFSSSQLGHRSLIVGATKDSNNEYSYGGKLADCRAIIPYGKLDQVEIMTGNIVLVPKFVYNRVGLLDSYYIHDKGDTDYSLMAKKNGISIFQAPSYLGRCERHFILPNWMNPNVGIVKRFRSFHSITGVMPNEIFHLERKHYGIKKAVLKVIYLYLRCLYPKIVIMLGKEKEIYKIKF